MGRENSPTMNDGQALEIRDAVFEEFGEELQRLLARRRHKKAAVSPASEPAEEAPAD